MEKTLDIFKLYKLEYSLTETTLDTARASKENSMMGNIEEQDLKDRLSLIETMIAEGRRTTGTWAWTFVFWGVAYYVAILWTAFNHWPWAWLVTMMVAWVLCWAIIRRKVGSQPERKPSTTVGRAIFSVWIAMGVSLSLLLPALGFSGRFNQNIFACGGNRKPLNHSSK